MHLPAPHRAAPHLDNAPPARSRNSAPVCRSEHSNDPGIPFIEKVERHYFSERFPFEPFGDPFDHHPEMRQKTRQRREAARQEVDAASPPSLKQEL